MINLGNGIYVAGLQIPWSICISDNISVFSAELLAILWSMWWIEQVKSSKSIICLDSVAALLALRDHHLTSKAHPDLLLEILCHLFRIKNMGCHVGFLWVP